MDDNKGKMNKLVDDKRKIKVNKKLVDIPKRVKRASGVTICESRGLIFFIYKIDMNRTISSKCRSG